MSSSDAVDRANEAGAAESFGHDESIFDDLELSDSLIEKVEVTAIDEAPCEGSLTCAQVTVELAVNQPVSIPMRMIADSISDQQDLSADERMPADFENYPYVVKHNKVDRQATVELEKVDGNLTVISLSASGRLPAPPLAPLPDNSDSISAKRFFQRATEAALSRPNDLSELDWERQRNPYFAYWDHGPHSSQIGNGDSLMGRQARLGLIPLRDRVAASLKGGQTCPLDRISSNEITGQLKFSDVTFSRARKPDRDGNGSVIRGSVDLGFVTGEVGYELLAIYRCGDQDVEKRVSGSSKVAGTLLRSAYSSPWRVIDFRTGKAATKSPRQLTPERLSALNRGRR